MRRHSQNALHHTYKITRDRGVLFYRPSDHLVYYTLQSVLSRRHHLPVLGTSHMYTHVHEGVQPVDLRQLSAYEHDLSSIFSREYNREAGRKGVLFSGRFGSAPKHTDKDKRSSLIYVFNNPVEKKLVGKAVADRWNFLAYYEHEYPFSRKPVIRYCRRRLVDAIHQVEHEFKAGRYLNYALLHRLFGPLDPEEKEQLTDFIIQLYFFFDRKSCEELFGSLGRMVSATELTTGKEFEVGETFEPFSDIPYREMCQVADQYGLLGPGMALLRLPEVRKARLAQLLRQRTSASDVQVARFLHYTAPTV